MREKIVASDSKTAVLEINQLLEQGWRIKTISTGNLLVKEEKGFFSNENTKTYIPFTTAVLTRQD